MGSVTDEKMLKGEKGTRVGQIVSSPPSLTEIQGNIYQLIHKAYILLRSTPRVVIAI